MRLSVLRFPFAAGSESIFLQWLGGGGHDSGAEARRENDFVCEQQPSCPGRGAARSGAPQSRDLRKLGVCNDPGSAAHHFVLRCARETWLRFAGQEKESTCDEK
jgi:hypothetical protein